MTVVQDLSIDIDNINFFTLLSDLTDDQLEIRSQHVFMFKTSTPNTVLANINFDNILIEFLSDKEMVIWPYTTLHKTIRTVIDKHSFSIDRSLLLRIALQGKDMSGSTALSSIAIHIAYDHTVTTSLSTYRTASEYYTYVLDRVQIMRDKQLLVYERINVIRKAFDLYRNDTTNLDITSWSQQSLLYYDLYMFLHSNSFWTVDF